MALNPVACTEKVVTSFLRDIQMFDNARLEFLAFDETHTYGGAIGGESACLVRRLRALERLLHTLGRRVRTGGASGGLFSTGRTMIAHSPPRPPAALSMHASNRR